MDDRMVEGEREYNERLSDADVRAMVRLLGEVAATNGGHDAKKRLLMDGLCRLINADFWVWGLASRFEPGEQPDYAAMLSGGFAPEQFTRFLVALGHPDLASLTASIASEVANGGRHVTRLRQDMDPHDRFSTSDASRLWCEADVGPVLLSFRPVRPDATSVVALYRRFDSPLFDRRARKIAHIILTEVPWLHEQGWPWSAATKVPQLPHRCRLALNLMLEGLSRKQVADRMSLSIHTVNDYAKQIYAWFRVNSHAELVRRFHTGDGGHTP